MNSKNIVKLIGLTRLTMLGLTASVFALFFAIFLFVVNPMLVDAQDQLSRVQGEIGALRGKINSVKQDIEYMNENVSKYEAILKQGFFEDQDRFRVVSVIDELKSKAGVEKFSYTIGEREDVPSEDAKTMGYALVKRSIKLTSIAAVIDADIYSFFQRIKDIFPLYVHIKDFSIKRNKNVDIQVLRDIANSKEKNMVTAEISFDWVTLSKKDMNKEGEEGQQGRGRR